MDNNTNYDKKYFQTSAKKRQSAFKSINNYISQLKFHYELTDEELGSVLKMVCANYKKTISSKKWWKFFC